MFDNDYLYFINLINKANCLINELCPPRQGGGTYRFGANPVDVGVGVTFLSAQYLVNQWLDSYKLFMNI